MKVNIGVIGGGNMGSAIVSGIRKKYDVAVCEQDRKRRQWLKRRYKVMTGGLNTIAQMSKVIILAVKPQDFDSVLKELKLYLIGNPLVISVAAGITCRYIEKRLGSKTRVIRTMPNLPAHIGRGITGICAGKAAKKKDVILAQKLFSCVGKTIVVDEKYMDAVTAASGSGPAYVFLFMESLQKAVRSLGLKDSLAKMLVMQTVKGSLDLMEQRKEDASVLRARVTSKGGTTQAAMEVFERNKIGQIFLKALAAAGKRAKELSK